MEPTTWSGTIKNSSEFYFCLIDEISWNYWNLDWLILIWVIFAKVEFWYRKLRSLNYIGFTFWNFWWNFWGWKLKPLVIGSNSLCDFQENLFGITVFLPALLVFTCFQLNHIYIWPLKTIPYFHILAKIIWLTCSRMEFWMINKFNFRNWIH